MMARGIIDELMPSFKSGIGRYDDQVYDIRSVFLARFCTTVIIPAVGGVSQNVIGP